MQLIGYIITFTQGNTITRKDSLARCLKRMRMVHGTIFNFFPVSFNLPNDYTKFLSYFSKIQSKKGKQVFYIKLVNLSLWQLGALISFDLEPVQAIIFILIYARFYISKCCMYPYFLNIISIPSIAWKYNLYNKKCIILS